MMQCLHNLDAGIEIISIPATKVAVEGDTPHLPPREVEFASYCESTLTDQFYKSLYLW